MTGGIWNQSFESPEAVAIALHMEFPAYRVIVRRDRGQPPRFELLARDDRNPSCLISADAEEIWRELKGQ
jgi:hypothetical protein